MIVNACPQVQDELTSPRPVCQGGMTRPPPFLSGSLANLLEISQVFVTGLCLCPRETRNARSVDDMTSDEEDEEEAFARKPNCACICGCLYLVQERKILQARTGHRQAHVHETQTHPLEPNLQSASSWALKPEPEPHKQLSESLHGNRIGTKTKTDVKRAQRFATFDLCEARRPSLCGKQTTLLKP